MSTAGRGIPCYRCPGERGTTGHVVRKAGPLDAYIEAIIVERLSRPDAIELLRPAAPEVDLSALRATANAARARLTEIAEMLLPRSRRTNTMVRPSRQRTNRYKTATASNDYPRATNARERRSGTASRYRAPQDATPKRRPQIKSQTRLDTGLCADQCPPLVCEIEPIWRPESRQWTSSDKDATASVGSSVG